jgi:hypothetical protein
MADFSLFVVNLYRVLGHWATDYFLPDDNSESYYCQVMSSIISKYKYFPFDSVPYNKSAKFNGRQQPASIKT